MLNIIPIMYYCYNAPCLSSSVSGFMCVCVYLKLVVSYPGNLIVDLSLIRLAQTSFTLSMYSHTARIQTP